MRRELVPDEFWDQSPMPDNVQIIDEQVSGGQMLDLVDELLEAYGFEVVMLDDGRVEPYAFKIERKI